jgi:ABC-type antimicrobial peptide transport system permease subunit
MIATTVAVCMGILFGLMPAYKAAKLKVIDALSFE